MKKLEFDYKVECQSKNAFENEVRLMQQKLNSVESNKQYNFSFNEEQIRLPLQAGKGFSLNDIVIEKLMENR